MVMFVAQARMRNKRNGFPLWGRGSSAGFTLLELLISMTLLVVIVVIAFGAMRISSRSMSAGERKMDALERYRTVLSIIDSQVESHIPLTYMEEGNKKYYFRGDGKNVRFSTNYSIWGGRKGYIIVNYSVEMDPAGREVLFAAEQVPGIEGRRVSRMIEASAIYFDYFVKDAAEEQGRWVAGSYDGLNIPERIRVHLIQGPKKLSLAFPVRVGGKITAVQGGTAASPVSGQGVQNVR